jgi:hypothetical protein
MFNKCKHKWTKQSDVVMKSALQELLDGGLMELKGFSFNTKIITKCHVVVLTCDLCGKVHKEVTRNTDK